ncbi:MAG: DUF4105 domain-containing protein [Elusimicrobiota bacterium]|nr:DUF4105 domain-containing protein [Elusimicrobiota bacterium]
MVKKRSFQLFGLFLFLSLLTFSSPAPAQPLTPEKNLQRLLIRQAAVKAGAWKDAGWLKLLYYDKTIFGRSRSASTNPRFFLAKWGDISPRLELEAAIDGLYFEGAPDDSPECRFPERYRWLREKLGLPVSDFPPPQCKNFEDWKAGLDPESVSLVYAAGYLNSPSALYGHIFLRLHKRGAAAADQPDHAVNYAVAVDKENEIFFATNWLFGAYPGQFSTTPYHLKIQEYSDLESRDVWEFPLGLTQDETDRLLRHLWELEKASFRYLFLTRNSSRQLLPLLDIAKPELALSRRFRSWVLPSDAVKAALTASPEAAPAWRPSLLKTLDWKRSRLTAAESTSVLELSRGDQHAELRKLETAAPDRKAAVLETAADYLKWLHYARRIGKYELDSRMPPLFQDGVPPERQPAFNGGPAQPPSLLEAHESLRLGAGLVSLKSGPAYEIQGRFALQDILDAPEGCLPDAALETGAFRLRYEKRYNRLYLKEGRLAHITSLTPWDDWTRRQSWEISAGVEQADETGRQSGRSAVWAMNAGSGFAAEVSGPVRQLWYAMLQVDSGFGPALNANWRAGAGVKAGLLAGNGPLRALIEARYIGYVIGDTRPLWAGSAAASLRLSKNRAARLEYSWRGEVKEAGLYFHQFLPAP